MRARIFVLAFAFLGTFPAAAAAQRSPLDDTSLAGENRYIRCQSLIKVNAHEAVTAADNWHRDEGGGTPALHCEALALTALHRYAEAAATLDIAAMGEAVAQKELRVALFDQAGNAWLLAGQPQKAEAAIDSALAIAPNNEDALFDRARARAARKNWPGAESDLTALLSIDAARADVLVLRASARHAEGRKDDAKADIARALQIYPNYPEALVEQGSMKYEAGDTIGARADWEEVVRDTPNSDAGKAASAHLSEMDAATAKPPDKQ